jgi:Flp pilus assembly protein TadD
MGQPHLAGRQYNQAAAWDPKRTARLKAKLERFFADLEANPTPAEQAYREARRLEHSQIGPKRMTDEVRDLARRAVALEPANRNYLWYLLRVQMARRENEEAAATSAQLLAVDPYDGRGYAMRAFLLIEDARTESELAEIEKLLKKAQSDPEAEGTVHYVRGLIALQRKQGELAAKELSAAAKLDPKSDVILYKLAQAHHLRGDRTAAERAMASYRKRQEMKRRLAEALGDVSRDSRNPAVYSRAAQVFESFGLSDQAKAIRGEARKRFGKAANRNST